ncbi:MULTISPECIES: hypothetical protein [unclassified Oleiphilus]|jgi:hypothetical protein|uniref:hypothetical protein n=1 Tax=unclassified Oleiphilus TaxID=2631174 RepID=UPI0007C29FC1|nr:MULTISPECIES: hypothetical protein [unclassified Oleiphilus]KZY76646.1 hypothetical protein A3740_12240 [Oleiphilus sp. HI0068]KZY81464.1 hypothetical protein A3741_17265 [Oleiphilus sp. HI0069]KZZ45730.1 hypothetical protein A3755_03015 [Oleiphilus sp. HI0085]KZZ35136.1 hypothetical protein A3756_16340 [Oleiphilus sp. HI0086]KZZ75898.1 hypothetical protein A3766_15480 [Oleiphilus sp. HI0132]
MATAMRVTGAWVQLLTDWLDKENLPAPDIRLWLDSRSPTDIVGIGSIKHLFTPKLKYHTRNCCSFLLPKPQNLASQRPKQVVFWSI